MWKRAALVFVICCGIVEAQTTLNLHCLPTAKPGLCILNSIKVKTKDFINPTSSSSTEKVVQFENSQLDYFPPVLFNKFPELETLLASNVGLKKLWNDTFAHSTNLKHLDISSNFVSVLPENVFGTCHNLKVINVAENRLHLFKSIELIGCKQLRHLNVSSNQLIYINWDPLSDLRQLEQLDLGNNLITELIIPKYLRRLVASNNHIYELSTDRDAFIFMLEYLDASRNRLSNIDKLSHLAKLTYIDLSYNRLLSVDFALFKNMRLLRELRLAHNNIFAVTTSELKPISLELVDLSYNELAHLAANDSAGIGSTVKLLLNNNYLMSFEVTDGLLNFPNLREISLNGNDWTCKDIDRIMIGLKAKNVNVIPDHQQCAPYQISRNYLCCRDVGVYYDELILMKSEDHVTARVIQKTVPTVTGSAPEVIPVIHKSSKDMESRLMAT
ncbi:toll-like receptor 6 [Topomyia yanbarensis]|uniref:toll-like receptor 6 n=1 Tax=Topomyia yanbarensis TaxID=2498891 RepID=UPI00273C4D78|nr:toll-like receptor 6 [Topomyia yanbarensis]